MPYFTVKYYAGSYSGKRRVRADDEEDAIAKVRGSIRKEMTLPMYSDGYKIVDSEEEEEDESDD